MSNRKTDAVVNILLITGIVIAINIVSGMFFFRLDFTRNEMYTISDSTKNLLKDLKNPLYIKFYVSEELPPKVQPVKRDISDILREYENYGDGNVRFSTLIPEKDKDIENDARQAGIQKVQLNVIEESRSEVQEAYIGVALYYGDKLEVLPVVMSIENLEYELTSAILRLSKENKEKIVFLGKETNVPNNPNMDPRMRQQLMQQMQQGHSITRDAQISGKILEQLYTVEEITLKDGTELPTDTKLVIINGINTLSDWEKYQLDQFLLTGGKVIVLQSGMDYNQKRMGKQSAMMGEERKMNYFDMLENYGLTLNKNTILDHNSHEVTMRQGFFPIQISFPYWIKVGDEQISKEIPDYLRETGVLAFTFSSSIDIDKKSGIEYQVIAKSSSKSWEKTGTVFVNPGKEQKPDEADMKQFNLAVLAKGKFSSAFSKENLPAGVPVANFKESASKSGKLLLIGSEEFVLDRTVQQLQSNIIFFSNLVDYMTDNKDLAGIRSKKGGYSHISAEITDGMKTAIKWFGTLFIPIIVVLFGIFRMMMRDKVSGRKQ